MYTYYTSISRHSREGLGLDYAPVAVDWETGHKHMALYTQINWGQIISLFCVLVSSYVKLKIITAHISQGRGADLMR